MAKRLYKLGSLAQDTRTGLKVVFKSVLKDDFDTLQYPFGTNYQVPANKNFYITNILFRGDTARTTMRILYGDDVVTASATPPTNAVYISPFHLEPVADIDHYGETFIIVPELKYPAIEMLVGNGVVELQGLEI
ncbi:MAG: hypothetical protein V3R52_07490 [Candidatus Neomarinimicrobiota bacterium]